MYDYIIVGSGIFGSVFAHELNKLGKKVLILEKRNHIGGNCYTEKIENINVHKYGPHIFHTNDKRIWDYVNQFADFNNFVNRPKVNFEQNLYSFPINLFTLYQLWGVKTPQEAKQKLEQVKISNNNPKNLEEWILSQVGEEIYEKFIKGYTTKQWGKQPNELPSSIIKRLPIRLTFDDNYFNDRFQGIPIGGYTQIFEKMLNGVELMTEVDFLKNKTYFENKAKKIVFTGKIDELYDYAYGQLEYRSLKFETQTLYGDFQGNAVINYTQQNIPYTRICEHKHFEFGNQEKTVITKEFPDVYDNTKVPYYPIADDKNLEIYNKYKNLTEKQKRYILGGRLAEYKYYDMHQIIASALVKFKTEILSV
jgi:UDP-galactopyranose mutase